MSVAPHPTVGIEKITAYPCTLSLDMVQLAEARGVDARHPLEELLVTHRSLNPVWEDPVTMAVNAAMQILSDEDRAAIELVIVGSESAVDYGKPIASWVHRFCKIQENCRVLESKHACYGGTGALMMAAHFVASGIRPGAKALVVCADQSRTHLNKPWEFVLGAGATAILVSDQPQVLAFELAGNGYWSNEISDTFRPTARNEVGHADTSLFGYLDAVTGSFTNFRARNPSMDYEKDFVKHIYHIPFGGMTQRAHKAVMRMVRKCKRAEIQAAWEQKTRPSLHYNGQFGGTYTSATFVAMLGLIDQSPELTPGDRITVFSYGSGSCSEFYSAKIGPQAQAAVKAQGIQAGLDARHPVSVQEYEAIEKARQSYIDRSDYEIDRSNFAEHYERAYAGQKRLILHGVHEWERDYRWS